MKRFLTLLAAILVIGTSCTAPSSSGDSTPPSTYAAFSRPLISIEFDDGWKSAHVLGLPEVRKMGWVPTQYVITDTAEHPNLWGTSYMTPAMIQGWVAQGGDIASHTVDHQDLTELTPAHIKAEMVDSKSWLSNLLGTAPRLFASPYCGYNDTIMAIAAQVYDDMRNCDDPTNVASNWNPMNVHSLSVLNSTSDAEIDAAIQAAIASNGWTVFVFHEVGIPADPADPTYTVSVARLKAILQRIAASGVTVVSSTQAFDEVRSAPTLG